MAFMEMIMSSRIRHFGTLLLACIVAVPTSAAAPNPAQTAREFLTPATKQAVKKSLQFLASRQADLFFNVGGGLLWYP